MIRGAGILFLTPDNKALFLKRGAGGDWPLHWCFPGGTHEPNETIEECAIREAIEELGTYPQYVAKGPLIKHCVTIVPTQPPGAPLVPDASPPEMVEFTTFVQRIEDTFEPHVNGEHIGFGWAPADQPPLPIHPGCLIALKKLKWNELDIARAIRDGDLASPQQYENMWLFALRITGTGTAYRRKHDEFVIRKPEIYLNDDFLARCNGLPVIVEHPKSAKLDSREYAERNIGSIFLPYIKGDEVWGIAKIYDAESVEMMLKHQLSTSPSVVLRGPDNVKLGLEGGKTLLIEGEPHLLDHLAICTVGVWDKGQDPSGVLVEAKGDSQMADKAEDKKEDKKADEHIEPAKQSSGGESGGKELDKMLSGLHTKLDDCMKKMDSISGRMDAMDKARDDDAKRDDKKRDDAKADATKDDKKADAAKDDKKDDSTKKDATGEEPGEAKETVADKKKRGDEDEKEKKEEKKEDAVADAKADSDPSIRQMLDDMNKRIADGLKPQLLSDGERNELSDAQARADGVFAQFGEKAPYPQLGEKPLAYRRRVAGLLKKHSGTWKGVPLEAVADSAAFDVAERQIYADASSAAIGPDTVPEGMLRAISRTTPTGHTITRFAGHPSAWMNQFAPNRRYCTRINPKPQNQGM